MKVKDIVNVTSDKYIAITGSEGYAEISEKEEILHDYADVEVVNSNNPTRKGRVKKMAVSEVTLSYVDGEIGTRLIKDVKSTSLNKNILRKYKKFIEKLEKGEFKKR